MAHSNRQPASTGQEEALRRHLGIPPEAARVLIFAESSHWDPDWLYTSEEYFRRWVRPNLDRALEELAREPQRIYSVECMFFLRLYWERCPQRQEAIRALVNEGRLRLTSSGVTTADTLIPRPEAILRDWLIGQEWLRANGMLQEPRLAYFADSFGASGALPSLLRAAGYDMAAITRLDGSYCLGADYEGPGAFPRPGSSAELLMRRERSNDFVWRGPDGAEVLTHWNAFTYGQGDLLASSGVIRVYIAPLARPNRSDRHVAARIASYVRELAPLARTPYLFCPIGEDFVPPIEGLVALLERYNRLHYPTTGTWALNAGLDDYLALVDCHRSALPVLELDPNPYWSGFYTARPTLKRQCHELVEDLLLAERLALRPGSRGPERRIASELARAWCDAATANHHDFITGTSTDRVVEQEQQPWLKRAAGEVSVAIAHLAPQGGRPPRQRPATLPRWEQASGKVEVHTPYYSLALSEEAGGAITGAWRPDTGAALLAGLSNDLVSYRDSGGLWRMGFEFRGGTFKEAARASRRPSRLEVREGDEGLEVSCIVTLDGEAVRRTATFTAGSPLIRLRVEGRAAPGRTVTVRLATGVIAERVQMDVPGATVDRPRQKAYQPTFWPLQSFIHARDEKSLRGVALLFRLPGAASLQADGTLEAVALRNATHERAWGVLPLPAMPATGHERASYAFEYALCFTAVGDWRENNLPLLAAGLAWPGDGGRSELARLAAEVVTVDRPEVQIIAVKPASRGGGLIVRLYSLQAPGAEVRLRAPGRVLAAAALCDARERDLERLAVSGGAVRVKMPGTIATVRLVESGG